MPANREPIQKKRKKWEEEEEEGRRRQKTEEAAEEVHNKQLGPVENYSCRFNSTFQTDHYPTVIIQYCMIMVE